jgi:hypothetical protein
MVTIQEARNFTHLYRNLVFREGEKLLSQSVTELLLPLFRQPSYDFLSTLEEVGPVAPDGFFLPFKVHSVHSVHLTKRKCRTVYAWATRTGSLVFHSA